MNQAATVTISAQARQLSSAEMLAPVKNKIIALEAENSALHESLEHHLAELQRSSCVVKQQTLAILEAYTREQEVADLLARIIHKAHLKNSVEVLRLATEALRALA